MERLSSSMSTFGRTNCLGAGAGAGFSSGIWDSSELSSSEIHVSAAFPSGNFATSIFLTTGGRAGAPKTFSGAGAGAGAGEERGVEVEAGAEERIGEDGREVLEGATETDGADCADNAEREGAGAGFGAGVGAGFEAEAGAGVDAGAMGRGAD